MIRNATALDKTLVLKFCRNTFSWGDYIDQVWNFWLSEGSLLLFERESSPAGICHALYTSDQVWIEGIRVDPNFQRQKIASELIRYAESIGRKKSIPSSHMLIDTENTPSLLLTSSLGYGVFQTWNFYSLKSGTNSNYDIHFEKSLDRQLYSHYVKSWRWLPIDDSVLSVFYKKNQIVKSCIDGNTSIAILADSEHFDDTLIVTLFSGSPDATLQIISFLQNYGAENHYERIQILTKEELSASDSLEYRISFHLVKKSLD